LELRGANCDFQLTFNCQTRLLCGMEVASESDANHFFLRTNLAMNHRVTIEVARKKSALHKKPMGMSQFPRSSRIGPPVGPNVPNKTKDVGDLTEIP
jgi:hypothetical protein